MVYPLSMTTPSKPVPQKDDHGRDERLAAALRENLRRRKAQARAQDRIKHDGAKPEVQPAQSPRK